MKKSLLTALAFTICILPTVLSASAQNAILAQMYGKGVHAYYSGNQTEARKFLSMAIDNGSKDPRAYYFRGMAAYASDSISEAESDWRQGAQLEAQGRTNPFVSRALTRFQGTGRLKLEQIRQQARLQAMVTRAARSNQRIGEINASSDRGVAIHPQPTPPPPSVIPKAAGQPTAPPAAEDPFAGDLAEGEAKVTENDALEGAMDDPFANEPAPAADPGAPADGDLFEGEADDSDPFGESGNDGAMEDAPVGGDEDDPFAE